jgi:hypothetical protein
VQPDIHIQVQNGKPVTISTGVCKYPTHCGQYIFCEYLTREKSFRFTSDREPTCMGCILVCFQEEAERAA